MALCSGKLSLSALMGLKTSLKISRYILFKLSMRVFNTNVPKHLPQQEDQEAVRQRLRRLSHKVKDNIRYILVISCRTAASNRSVDA
jgi:hypothetical protein